MPPRTALLSAAKLLLFLSLSSAAFPRAAAQVLAPTGATLPKGSPILVQWTTSYFASWPTVDLFLYQASPGLLQSLGPLAADVDNDGQAYVSLPRSFKCDPAALYQISVGAAGNRMGKVHHSPGFKLSCTGGSLTVLATVVHDGGVPVPDATFRVSVACEPNGPNTTLALSGANGFQDSVPDIPRGNRCTINERAPRAPPDCRWSTVYPQGRSIVIGDAAHRREVRNRLDCQDRAADASAVPGVRSTVRGSAAITEGSPGEPGRGFRFATGSNVPDTAADIRGLGGDIATDPGGAIISMGFCSFDTVTSVPAMITGNSAGANMGECYAVRTSAGRYAAIRITSIGGAFGGGSTVRFDYKFQPSGSSAF